MKGIFLLLVFSLLKTGVTAQTRPIIRRNLFYSLSRKQRPVLADYGDNAYQLERMGNFWMPPANRLLKGDNHS
ncbi:hypothetical protein [Parabacteroides goldsteinii]|uniref:hypothetical protein n=1 Tax=Parabacteroides goldsteinii TaxID=328812 RepID=UPI001F33A5D7|nr:hypothetical protein [Parabacteroides goldsteinii]